MEVVGKVGKIIFRLAAAGAFEGDFVGSAGVGFVLGFLVGLGGEEVLDEGFLDVRAFLEFGIKLFLDFDGRFDGFVLVNEFGDKTEEVEMEWVGGVLNG